MSTTDTGPAKAPLGRKLAIAAVCVAVAAAGTLAYFLLRDDKAPDFEFPGDHHVVIYLDRDVQDDDRDQLESELLEHPLVEEVEFESQAEAYEKFQDTFSDDPDLLDSVEADTLPSSFRVKLTDADRSEEFIQEFENADGVYEISDIMTLYRYYKPACVAFEEKGIGPAEGDTDSVLFDIEQACKGFVSDS